MATVQRFGELKNTDRESTCKTCRNKIASGSQRFWDNLASVNGPVCVACYARAESREIDETEKAPPREGASQSEIQQVNAKLAAMQTSLDVMMQIVAKLNDKIDAVLKQPAF